MKAIHSLFDNNIHYDYEQCSLALVASNYNFFWAVLLKLEFNVYLHLDAPCFVLTSENGPQTTK